MEKVKEVIMSMTSPTRKKILDNITMQHSMVIPALTIVEISELCDISPALASHHIKALESQGLLACREVGNKKLVMIDDMDSYLSLTGLVEEISEVIYHRAEKAANIEGK